MFTQCLQLGSIQSWAIANRIFFFFVNSAMRILGFAEFTGMVACRPVPCANEFVRVCTIGCYCRGVKSFSTWCSWCSPREVSGYSEVGIGSTIGNCGTQTAFTEGLPRTKPGQPTGTLFLLFVPITRNIEEGGIERHISFEVLPLSINL